MNELEARISKLNNSAKKINLERQQSIGRREALLKQQEDAIKAYNAKYNKNITPETVRAEYERVSSEKQEEVAKVEKIISAIETGNFDLANQLSGVEPESKSGEANDTYVQAVTETVQKEEAQASVVEEPLINEEPEETVEPTAPKGSSFIPSPISNPMNEQTGDVSGFGSGGSIFDRDFSQQSDDDDMGTPPAPPSLAGLV